MLVKVILLKIKYKAVPDKPLTFSINKLRHFLKKVGLFLIKNRKSKMIVMSTVPKNTYQLFPLLFHSGHTQLLVLVCNQKENTFVA